MYRERSLRIQGSRPRKNFGKLYDFCRSLCCLVSLKSHSTRTALTMVLGLCSGLLGSFRLCERAGKSCVLIELATAGHCQ